MTPTLFALLQQAGDGWEKVSDAAGAAGVNESIPAGKFVSLAYGFIWAAVCVYLVLLHRRAARIAAEADALRERLERREGGRAA